MKYVDTSKFKVHSDITGYQTSNGGSLPPSLIVTTLKPDIVILDETKKEAFIFELTCPFEQNIHKRHKQKADKYAQFETDIKSYATKVNAFEIGSRGTITPDNLNRLSHIHKYLNKNIRKNTFIKNIRALSTLSSYYIFTARKHTSWEHTDTSTHHSKRTYTKPTTIM